MLPVHKSERPTVVELSAGEGEVWVNEVRLEDDELLRRCQQGDESALELLVERFQDRIFRLAYRVLGDAARAEESAVDALVAVWNRCGSWRGEARAATWIHQVAWRVVLDHQRARRRWWRFRELDGAAREIVAKEQDAHFVVAAQEETDLAKQQMDCALLRLSEDERALIHLHYYEGLSLAEIAPILEASRDALKMRLSRLRQKLKGLLGKDGMCVGD